MVQAAEAKSSSEPATLGALFVGFLKVSLCGFGGGLVWARRIVVERERWMEEQEFGETLTLCQFNGWVTDREFADFYAVSQVVPGPNMILMMSLIGLKVGGVPGAIAGAIATFGPPCVMYFMGYSLWNRFRDMPWQRIVGRGLSP